MAQTPARRALSFVDGIGVGIAGTAALPLLKLISEAGTWSGTYREINPTMALPVLTQLVLHPAWRIGVPVVLFVAFVVALVRPPRQRHAILALGLVAALAVVLTYIGLYDPLTRLAASIKPG